MKPDKIIILRHGQSLGNVDKGVYAHTPDYALKLSDNGHRQAMDAAEQLRALLSPGGIQYYVSPYWRTRQTYEQVASRLAPSHPGRVHEDPRLREQEWSGDFRKMNSPDDYSEVEDRRDSYGHFYFRLEGGESCADVYDRVSDFLNTMHRDFEKRDFQRNVVIVTHGMTMRIFLMRWFHMKVEEFELLANPLNCGYYIMQRNTTDDRYTLVTLPRTHKIKHKFQFKPMELSVRPTPAESTAFLEQHKTGSIAFQPK